jgi:cytosine/uracil/thiamine/allantoin permease
MNHDIVPLTEDVSKSPLYSPDLAPVPAEHRTWNKWNLAALWVGMAVCIPTYILASYMMKSGLSWQAALIIIGLANLVITLPMALNGHAGVRYGVPFPVIGRVAFGTKGIYAPSFVRGLVACGWFGVQTWIGGLAFYSIWNAITGAEAASGLSVGKFVAFALFWVVNMYFIWKGTESIKWLEDYSAPILIVIGLVLIGWGYQSASGFMTVLNQGEQLQRATATLTIPANTDATSVNAASAITLRLQPIKNLAGAPKAKEFQYWLPLAGDNTASVGSDWKPFAGDTTLVLDGAAGNIDNAGLRSGKRTVRVQVRTELQPAESQSAGIQSANQASNKYIYSSMIDAAQAQSTASQLWNYILWFTAMVGFWATMSLSIADITRFAKSQRDQIAGQFMGLPGTMIFYSFVGIFVTCAAVVSFGDVLIAEDAPWDPVTLVSKFQSPFVVVFAQIAMIIATLSTNIAANVIAPANVFSNLFPKKISFRMGGLIAGLIGVVICPWLLLDEISNALIFVSGLLGPVLGVMLCDYFVIRKTELHLAEMYKPGGEYSYRAGYNPPAMLAVVAGVVLALAGKWIPALEPLFSLSWFTGFSVAFVVYWLTMKRSSV